MTQGKVEICGVNTSKLPLLKAEEKEALFQQIEAGDERAREAYIEGNLRLVLSVIKRFSSSNENVDDLFQIGCIGLIKAIDNFDTSLNVKFSTYAVPLITGEIKRFIRDDGMVKVSRTLKENNIKVKYARERLGSRQNYEPTLEELAGEAGLSVEEVVLAMEAGVQVESIYKSVYQNDGNEIFMVDQLADEKAK